MRRLLVAAVCFAAGCGRLGFDATTDARDAPQPDGASQTCVLDDPALSATERMLLMLPADTWTSLPGTTFSAFCAANGYQPEITVCGNVVESYGGAVFDAGARMVLLFGGDKYYGGNEVYGFDLHQATWHLVAPPTAPAAVTPGSDPYADGHPASRRGYDGFAYLSDRQAMFQYGGGMYGSGLLTTSTWRFDPGSSAWTRLGDFDQNAAVGTYFNGTDYDAEHQRVLTRTPYGLVTYDVASNTWATVTDFQVPPYYPEHQTDNLRRGVVVPARHLFFTLGGQTMSGSAADVLVFDTTTLADVTGDWATTGDDSAARVAGLGVDYDSIADAIVVWPNGGAPARLDLATRTWTSGSAAGAPTTSATNATLGRWRYISYLNVFVVVSAANQNVAFYKHTNGCGS